MDSTGRTTFSSNTSIPLRAPLKDQHGGLPSRVVNPSRVMPGHVSWKKKKNLPFKDSLGQELWCSGEELREAALARTPRWKTNFRPLHKALLHTKHVLWASLVHCQLSEKQKPRFVETASFRGEYSSIGSDCVSNITSLRGKKCNMSTGETGPSSFNLHCHLGEMELKSVNKVL